MWPEAGGTFDFRLRYQVQALSAPSVIYDDYNPEARGRVLPVVFTVH